MKQSLYAIPIENQEQFWLVSTLTKTVIKVSHDIHKSFVNLPNEFSQSLIEKTFGSELAAILFHGGYVLNNETNEQLLLKDCVKRERENDETFALVVSPTLDCNAKCHYCFESNVNLDGGNTLTVEDMEALVLDKLNTINNLNLQWFGGEPLLEKEFVIKATKRLKELSIKNSVRFLSNIVTNGFLLDKKTAKALSKEGVTEAQITLEGDSIFHDKVRKLKAGGGTFDKIINNIQESSEFIDIVLRIHVAPYSIDSVVSLIETLNDFKVHRKIKEIYFAPLFNYKTCSASSKFNHDNKRHFGSEEFAEIEHILYKKSKKLGFPIPDVFRGHYDICTAARQNSVVVGNKGELYKCYFDLGNTNESYGAIDKGVENKINLDKWKELDIPLYEKCEDCKILPVCLSGCAKMFEVDNTGSSSCDALKFNIREMVSLAYE